MIFDFLKGSTVADSNPASIKEIGLSERTYEALTRAQLTSTEDLICMTRKDLLHVRGLGYSGTREVIETLDELGLKIKEDPEADYIRQPTVGDISGADCIRQPTEKEISQKTDDVQIPRKNRSQIRLDRIKVYTDGRTINNNKEYYRDNNSVYNSINIIDIEGLRFTGKGLKSAYFGFRMQKMLESLLSLQIEQNTENGEKTVGYLELSEEATVKDVLIAVPCYSWVSFNASNRKSSNFKIHVEVTKIDEEPYLIKINNIIFEYKS